MRQIRAIIADDEEALRSYLKKKLVALWPDLEIAGEARDGDSALKLIAEKKPDIAFLDIKMPGRSGIEVAKSIAGACSVVFVTAFDQYAIEAFESRAIDYILKPVSDERLENTVARLKERLERASGKPDLAAVLERLSQAMQGPSAGYLQWIKAQHKDGVRLIPVNEVCFFRATDKYTTLRTKDGEFLIRKSIKELEETLDPNQFWRVHRAALVNAGTIQSVIRSVAGTLVIRFKTIPDQLTVSRAYAHLFKQM
jgi:DNA-binding LytR/AlgR family response regulator